MTDSSGNQVNRYDYDPYGQVINQQEQGGLNNPWKFAAGYLDSSTGLYKFGTRYYDPSLGRWTQQDPVGGSLGDLNSANRYTYAKDDPVNLVDPSGAFTPPLIACFEGAVTGVAGLILYAVVAEALSLGTATPITLGALAVAAIVGCFVAVIADFVSAIFQHFGIG